MFNEKHLIAVFSISETIACSLHDNKAFFKIMSTLIEAFAFAFFSSENGFLFIVFPHSEIAPAYVHSQFVLPTFSLYPSNCFKTSCSG